MLTWEQELEKQGFIKRGVNSWYAYFPMRKAWLEYDQVCMEVFFIGNRRELTCMGHNIPLNTPGDIKTAMNIIIENQREL
jgi:hypothetical protein